MTDRDLAVDGFVLGVGRSVVGFVCLGYSVVLPRQQNRDAGATECSFRAKSTRAPP